MHKKAQNTRLTRRSAAKLLAAMAALGGGFGRPAEAALSGTIRFSWWGGPARNQKTNAVCDLFEKHEPGVKISREIADFQPYWDKLAVQSAAHNQPQAIQMQSRYINQYARGDTLRPLDDLVASGALSLDGIAEAALATGRQPDGKLYMQPYGIFFITSIFNTSMLQRVGLQPPRFDWTWDDFTGMAKTAAAKLPAGVNAVALLGGEAEPFFAWVGGHGEPVFGPKGLGFSKATMIAWYRMWEDLRKSGATYSADMMMEVHRSSIEDAPIALGKLMIDVKPANQLQAHIDVLHKSGSDMLDIQKQPSGPAGAGEVVGTNGIAIAGNCAPAEIPIAAAFVNFFAHDPAGAKVYASDNGAVAEKALQDAQIADPATSFGTRRQLQLLQQVLTIAKPEAYPKYYQAILLLLQRNYQAVAFGTMTIEQAVDQFFNEAERIIKA